MQLSPSQIIGVTSPDGTKTVSPESQDIIDRLKDHYRAQGKPSAAHNYGRHLKSFFAWAEGVGYTVKTLPVDAVESFLASLQAAGQKETTIYVMRTQLKSALREAHTVLGVDFAHLEYQIGKPKEVRQHQKAREKAKRHEVKAQQILAQAAAIQAAQQMIGAAPQSVEPVTPVDPTPTAPPESPMSTASAPAFDGPTATGSPPAGQAAPQQPVVVVQIPPNNTRPTATIGNPNVPQTSKAGTSPSQPARGIVIANHTFTGPYVKISRIADGTEPLIPPGTETYVQTLPASQLAPHGDVAAFLQNYIVPNLRLSPAVTQVQFVFHELNDRRQPTGRRDELVVSVPMQGGSLNGFNATPPPPPPTPGPYGQTSQDSATAYLLKKLDEEAAEAKRRADEYQAQMREAKDAQTTFMLMQAFQKEQDLRRELEDRRDRMAERDRPLPPPTPIMPPMPFLPPPMPVETKPDTSMADMVKAMADQQAKMMETVATLMRPAPPQPQKDVAEWLVPFIAQMNQQAQAQAQANQQMLMSVMQGNQQFMQALLTRENPTERLLMQQLMEVKAAAAAPKADELEDFADKLQKMKMVGEMIGGGAPSGGLLSELLANADTIGAGAAKVIAAARNGGASAAAAPQSPQRMLVTPPQQQMAGTPRQIPATAPRPEQRTEAPAGPPRPPDDAVRALTVVIAAEGAADDQTGVHAVMAEINALLAAPEPFKGMGTRLLNALKTADDEGELYTMAKNLWTVVGQQYDRPAAKSVARILARWYREIHMQVFGEERELPGNADTDTVRKAVDAMGGGETAPVIEEQEETDDEEQEEEQEEQDEQDGPEITDEGEEAVA